jgi:4-nitrophenyl phosphatase
MTYETPEALRDLRALIIDMDGVLWRGNTPIPGLNEFFDLLRERPIVFRLATNNSSKTPDQYVTKLASMGVRVSPDVVFTSAIATARYLAETAPGATVFLLGEDGLRQALLNHGLRLSDGHQADFVVSGWDHGINFEKLAKATLLIRGGARFVGTNPDRTWPSEQGLLPGTGATLAYLEAASGVRPHIVGKPERTMFDAAVAAMGVSAAHTAMLGDRLETDIAGARNAGLRSILVLTGASDETALAATQVTPDWIFQSIRELTYAWRQLSK